MHNDKKEYNIFYSIVIYNDKKNQKYNYYCDKGLSAVCINNKKWKDKKTKNAKPEGAMKENRGRDLHRFFTTKQCQVFFGVLSTFFNTVC